MPTTTKPAAKVACINPNTGNCMNIDALTYGLFSKALYHTLKEGGELRFTQMVKGVQDYFQQQNITFDGSVEWYAVTIKNDMQAKGAIEGLTEKGGKLHRLSKKGGNTNAGN
jgi:hypothetical protein